MTKTIELQLEERILDHARRLARARHCRIEEIFEDAVERLPTLETRNDPFLGMFKDDTELVDQVTRSAMEARGSHPLR